MVGINLVSLLDGRTLTSATQSTYFDSKYHANYRLPSAAVTQVRNVAGMGRLAGVGE